MTDTVNFPPIEVLIAMILVFVVGIILGAAISLPIVHKNCDIPLEKLTGDLIWRYAPDWILSVLGCIISIIVCFILISGMWVM